MTLPAEGTSDGPAPPLQAQAIEEACHSGNLGLVELVHDVQRSGGERPGLQRALERIARREASCLVVPELERLALSAAALGGLVAWFESRSARLILPELELDTGTATGRLAARALIAAGRLEREKLRAGGQASVRNGPAA